ncbi:MAG: TetR/AcrR family transcriptional regulator [Desulfobacterium sp.]|nr:TetR/AcrR family transcriptional regulator [Desulfobacterium sp.]
MPKVVDHDKFREELLENCFKIFSQKGYSKVSIREIAKETGLSTGSIYHYFKNKEDILEQMFSYIRKKNFGKYQELIRDVDSIEDRLKIITEFWKEHIDDYQDLMLLSIDYLRNNNSIKENKMFHDFSVFYITALSDSLELRTGEAEILFTYLMGVVMNSLLIPDVVKPENHISLIYETLKTRTETDGDKRPESIDTLVNRLFTSKRR